MTSPITIQFTRGGPLDGQHLFTNELRTWYQAKGGYYILGSFHEEPAFGAREASASYTWQPND